MRKMAKNWIFIISFFCFGCAQNKQSSQDLIPRETFKAILMDVQQYKLDRKINKTIHDSVPILNQILNKHNIHDSIYQKTVLFYSKNPEKILRVLKEVEASFDK